jgi:hypothetical protein
MAESKYLNVDVTEAPVALEIHPFIQGDVRKWKVVVQGEQHIHVRVVRAELVLGRVTLILAESSEAAGQLRREMREETLSRETS